jgi:prevent-host-death family protein
VTIPLDIEIDPSPYYTYIADLIDPSDGKSVMIQTSALEFQRKFGEFQHQAQREPVEITRHGRREFVLMSAEHYDWLTAAARRTYRTVDATQVVIDAVERAEMDPEHAALDELLK